MKTRGLSFHYGIAATLALCAPMLAHAAAPTDKAAIWQWNGPAAEPTATTLFSPFAGTTGSVAARDLGTDGVDEIVVGSGFAAAPLVRILRGDGSEIAALKPFDADMTGGVNVAIGDLDGDGQAEIIAATGPGFPSLVRVLSVSGEEKIFPGGFSPFGDAYLGGVNVAAGDLDGDGRDELVVAAGPDSEPRIKVFRGDGVLLADFAAFDAAAKGGVSVAVGDTDGDGKAEIIAALSNDALANVRLFDGSGSQKAEFMTIGGGFSGGLNVAAADINGDGKEDVIVAPNGKGGPHVHVFGGDGTLIGHFFAYTEFYRGGVLLAAGTFKAGASASIVTAPAERTAAGRPQYARFISVDLSEQRLRAYEHGKLVKTFLVATGLPGRNTPVGEYSVLEKPLFVHYAWSYGPDNPDNYDFGMVKWNLRFLPHIYIHNAPWRKVYGVQGSHGCVNVNATNAEWIYNWADVGTPIVVQG